MISHEQAKEMHRAIADAAESGRAGYDGEYEVTAVMVSLEALRRAAELAALVVADTEPHPADKISYKPVIKGTIEIGDATSEFMLPLLNDSVQYSQWGADNYILGPRVDLLDRLSEAAAEWAIENLCRTCKENLLDDGEGYDGECGDCADKTEGKRSSTCTVCHEAITRDEDDEWVHSDGDKYCGTGDGAMALPEEEEEDD